MVESISPQTWAAAVSGVAGPLRLGVVVPARNEESSIDACLVALDVAARVAGLPLEAVVVLDGCEDQSAEMVHACAISLGCQVHTLAVDACRVGLARRIGVARLLELLGPGDHWVSTTDADSVVPPDWFTRQLTHRAGGAALVAGTVHVADWEERGTLRRHWERTYFSDEHRLADGHRHIHGANLSFSSHAYARVGGFDDVVSDEDVRLVRAFDDAGERVVWASDLSVSTSARAQGRAPRGFASYLNDLDAAAADPVPSLGFV